MKKYRFLIVGLFLLIQMESCETAELDLTQNPNALTDQSLDVDNLFVTIQENFARHIAGGGTSEDFFAGSGGGLDQVGMDLTRISNFFGSIYNATLLDAAQDEEWSNAYRGVLQNIETMIPIAEEQGLTRHVGVARFMQAYVYTSMVDYFGDIPFNDALQARDGVFAPTLTPGAEIYAAAFEFLDQADANFTNDAVRDPAIDLYYGNDYDKWQLATNSLRLKLLAQTRLVDATAEARFNAIVATGNYIQNNADDLQFQWGTSLANPETRNPRYVNGYSVTGAGDYISIWYMDQMLQSNDPRIRYVVYRQTGNIPSAAVPGGLPPNAGQIGCSVITNPPPQYLAGGFAFCTLDNGYWGRNHGSEEGIPADNFLRATWGVYPFGGRFDDNRLEEISLTTGAQGAGITPILTASLMQFLQAEMAMTAGAEGTAGTLLQQAVATHIDKVMNSGIEDPDADMSFAPTEQNVTDYLANLEADFQNADTTGKWNILGEQFIFGSVGMGIDSYNFYRRTNFPTTLEPNLNPDPGTFMNSLFYPANAVNNNSSISQKPNNGVFVYWDTNGTPPAN